MQNSDLSVQGLNLQTLYNLYYNDKLQVNRRYQRKLVWSVEEKEKLIDSVVEKLPIPLILLAQRQRGGGGGERLEIIDGLQRLNAFFDFMENKFSYKGESFDLETIGDTKAKRDDNLVIQGKNKMSRTQSLEIANYQIPVSIYRDATTSAIDEVFRRINSGGRRLSLQEIRQAGAIGPLPDLVRRLSASIRGDGTFSEAVLMRDMAALSISRKDLEYGLHIENMFWVRHDALGQEDIRSSGDEELVLDLILDIVIRPWPTSGWQNRDVAYGLSRRINTASLEEANAAVTKADPQLLHQQMLSIIQLIDEVMEGHGSLGRHMVQLETYEKGTQRQFRAIFSALYDITFKQNMVPKSLDAVRDVLKNFWSKNNLAIPTGGSAWGKESKAKLYPDVQKALKRAFYRPEPRHSVVQLNSRLYMEDILKGPVDEDPLIELKQGFCRLSNPPVEDTELFEEVMQTAAAMANYGPDCEGVIVIGIVDKPEDAARLKSLFNLEAIEVCGHLVTGTQEQIIHLNYNVDKWWRRWQERIMKSPFTSEFAHNLASSLKPVYCDGKLLWELRPRSINKPITYGNRFFVRIGPSTHELSLEEFLARMTWK